MGRKHTHTHTHTPHFEMNNVFPDVSSIGAKKNRKHPNLIRTTPYFEMNVFPDVSIIGGKKNSTILTKHDYRHHLSSRITQFIHGPFEEAS